MERSQWFLAVCLVPLSLACPATTKIALKNDSSTEIEVLSAYSDAVLTRIAPSGTETAVYNQDCVRIRTGNVILEYRPTMPPAAYYEVRTFWVLLSATFTRDSDLEITPWDGHADGYPDISLERGCEPVAAQ